MSYGTMTLGERITDINHRIEELIVEAEKHGVAIIFGGNDANVSQFGKFRFCAKDEMWLHSDYCWPEEGGRWDGDIVVTPKNYDRWVESAECS